MPYIKQEMFNKFKEQARLDLQRAQWDLVKNRRDIKTLAEQQHSLKKKVSFCARLMSEFEKRGEQEKK